MPRWRLVCALLVLEGVGEDEEIDEGAGSLNQFLFQTV
jgi:hypothetical protein